MHEASRALQSFDQLWSAPHLPKNGPAAVVRSLERPRQAGCSLRTQLQLRALRSMVSGQKKEVRISGCSFFIPHSTDCRGPVAALMLALLHKLVSGWYN